MAAGLLAKAVSQSVHIYLTARIREQARSHLFKRIPAYGRLRSTARSKCVGGVSQLILRPSNVSIDGN